jgi:hypothetical protein
MRNVLAITLGWLTTLGGYSQPIVQEVYSRAEVSWEKSCADLKMEVEALNPILGRRFSVECRFLRNEERGASYDVFQATLKTGNHRNCPTDLYRVATLRPGDWPSNLFSRAGVFMDVLYFQQSALAKLLSKAGIRILGAQFPKKAKSTTFGIYTLGIPHCP